MVFPECWVALALGRLAQVCGTAHGHVGVSPHTAHCHAVHPSTPHVITYMCWIVRRVQLT